MEKTVLKYQPEIYIFKERYKMEKKLLLFGIIMFSCVVLMAQNDGLDSLLLQVKDIDIYNPHTGDFLDVNPNIYAVKAYEYYNASDFETAAQYYLKFLQFNNSNANAIYNLACCYGLLGKDSLATSYLIRAYYAGFTDIAHIMEDPDFDGVRDALTFISLLDSLEKVQKKAEELRGTKIFIPANELHACRIKIPLNYDPEQSYPLIIGLHGWGDNADNFINVEQKFPEMNVIFVSPEAPYEFGPGTDIGYSWIQGYDDPNIFDQSVTLSEEYILNVIEFMKGNYTIDDVYLMGFSQGCWMTYYIGIRNPELFHGLLCFGGELPADMLGEDTLIHAKDLPVFIVHGENDRVIPVVMGENALSILQDRDYRCEILIFDGAHEIPEQGLKEGFLWLGLIH